MGTTRTSLEDGSSNWVYVLAIEGYSRLITNGSPAAAVTAWSGTDWSAALDGLHVDLTVDQRLDPDNPIGSMGTCTLWIQDENDEFGVAVHRRSAGAETYLDASADHDDTTVTVKSTSAFASSGDAHCGTECFGYTGKTGTTFTTVTRGKYSPFGTSSGSRFSHYHRVGLDANMVKLQPIVSAQPRTWKGRIFGLWIHRVVGGVLDVKSEAECVFSGVLGDIRDDANTGATVIQTTPLTEWIGDRVLGTDMWEGKINEGIYLNAGELFDFTDGNGGSPKTATRLDVVSTTPSGANQMAAGFYTLGDLCTKLSTWLASEKAAARIYGNYSVASPVSIPGGETRTKVYWTLAGSLVFWDFHMPASVAAMFGFTNLLSATLTPNKIVRYSGGGASGEHYFQSKEPLAANVVMDGSASARINTTSVTGTFVDQYSTLPSSIRPIASDSLSWGLFIVNDKTMILGAKVGDQITRIIPWKGIPQSPAFNVDISVSLQIPVGSNARVRQVFAIEYEFATLMLLMFLSTGTAGYNESFFDLLPRQLSLGIPSEMSGDNFVLDIPGTAGSCAIFLDKPKKFRDLIQSDLVIRWAFMAWRDGAVRFGTWRSPSATAATYTLDETTKAESSDVKSPQRSATAETSEFLKGIIKIEYNRDLAQLGDGNGYQSSLMFEDRVSVDDQGGASKVHTISLANTFSDFLATGQSAEALLPGFLANMPLISRPARVVERSIDPRYYWRIGVGDVVLFSDNFARDPATGTRRITDRPALVIKHNFNPGGSVLGQDKASPMGGRVTLFFTDADPDRTAAEYVPSADIDSSWSTGGFDAGYDSSLERIRVYEHRYSESSEVADAARFNVAGCKILIIERDPLDPDNPTMWEREVESVSSNDIYLTAALSSPAWDNTKSYRVQFQDYDTATAAQKLHTYQADDVDGQIIDTTGPFLYGAGQADSTYTENTSNASALYSEDIELVPTATFTDGAGRDVGHEVALARQLDNFIDYKSAVQSPMLFNTVVSNTTVTGTSYMLAGYWPIFLSYEILSNSILRNISVAPWAYSTDGTSTKIRVTLCRDRPSGSSLTDHTRGSVFGSAEWTGITSTTPGILSASTSITANVKHPFTGMGYVMLELGYKCASRGIARWVESARVIA